MAETRTLWDSTHSDKHSGRLISTGGDADRDTMTMMAKVELEMEAAIVKHGPVTPPANFIEDFYGDVERKKANIVSSA